MFNLLHFVLPTSIELARGSSWQWCVCVLPSRHDPVLYIRTRRPCTWGWNFHRGRDKYKKRLGVWEEEYRKHIGIKCSR